MGGSYSSNSVNESQNVANSAIQTSKNICESTCGNNNKNITVNIQNSSGVALDFQSTCSVLGSSCTVKNALDSSITNMLEATAKQTVTNVSNFLEFNDSNNYASITQNIRNNMAQLISNTCKSVAQNSNENIYVFIGNSKSVNVDFAQSANVSNANCAFDNTAKITVYNSATAKVTQSVKNIGILGIIAGIILLIIAAAIICGMMGKMKRQGRQQDEEDAKEREKERRKE